MANVPNPNSPQVVESEIKVFTQQYCFVDSDGECTLPVPRNARIEILADDNGVFIESIEGGAKEVLSIPTPKLALKVAEYINSVYAPAAPEPCGAKDWQLVLSDEDKRAVAHELWRLSNHFTSPHGYVRAQGASELMKHINYLEQVLRVKRAPHPDYALMDDNYVYKPVYQTHI